MAVFAKKIWFLQASDMNFAEVLMLKQTQLYKLHFMARILRAQLCILHIDHVHFVLN